MEYEEDELRQAGYVTEAGSSESLRAFLPDELHQRIERSNSRINIGDYQLSKLRVGGSDEFSRMNLKELLILVDTEVAAWVQETLSQSDRNQAVAIRWILRGLRPELAIRKMELRLQASETNQVIEQKGQD